MVSRVSREDAEKDVKLNDFPSSLGVFTEICCTYFLQIVLGQEKTDLYNTLRQSNIAMENPHLS